VQIDGGYRLAPCARTVAVIHDRHDAKGGFVVSLGHGQPFQAFSPVKGGTSRGG
jgi:hypothetical protein